MNVVPITELPEALLDGLADNTMIKVSAGAAVASGIMAGTITGDLTLAKTGTTARTVTFPDEAITLVGRAGALTENIIPRVTAAGSLADSALSDDGTTVSSTRPLSAPSAQIGQQSGSNANKLLVIGDTTTAVLPTHMLVGIPNVVGNRSGFGFASIDGSNNVTAGVAALAAQIVAGTTFPNVVGRLDVVVQNLSTSVTAARFDATKTTIFGTAPTVAPAAGTAEHGGGAAWQSGQIRTDSTTDSTTTATGSIVTAGGVGVAKAIVQASDQWHYFGASETDGTWRIGRDGDDFVHQRREAGVYVTKLTVEA